MDERTGVARIPSKGRPRTSGKAIESIVALDTASKLLQIISRTEGSISLSELSRLSGEAPNKLHRYLNSLKLSGFLKQSIETGLYDLGPEAFNLGMAALRRFDPLMGANDAMTRITHHSGLAGNLYTWMQSGPTLIAAERGIQAYDVMLRIGSVLPLCTSATGRVYLTFLPTEQTGEMLREELVASEREGAPIDKDYLYRQVEQIAKSRIYWTNRSIVAGTAAVLPCFDPEGNILATITSVIPRGQYSAATHNALERTMLSVCAEFQLGDLPANPQGLQSLAAVAS